MSTHVQQVAGELVVTTTDAVCNDCLEPLLAKLPGYSFLGVGNSSRWAWDELPDLDAVDALERHLVDPPEDCGHKAAPTDLF